jgi:hypothetical protein
MTDKSPIDAKIALSSAFSGHGKPAAKRKRPAPISLRLNEKEHARLARDAAGMSINGYVRDRLFGEDTKRPDKRGLAPVKDYEALAQVLSALGRSNLHQNIGTIAGAVRDGTVHLCPDVECSLSKACAHIAAMRRDLVRALGLKS